MSMLSAVTSPIYAECRYAECHYAECRYAECPYAECRYAECRGAVVWAKFSTLSYSVLLGTAC
jgi:hypothetical protein